MSPIQYNQSRKDIEADLIKSWTHVRGTRRELRIFGAWQTDRDVSLPVCRSGTRYDELRAIRTDLAVRGHRKRRPRTRSSGWAGVSACTGRSVVSGTAFFWGMLFLSLP